MEYVANAATRRKASKTLGGIVGGIASKVIGGALGKGGEGGQEDYSGVFSKRSSVNWKER